MADEAASSGVQRQRLIGRAFAMFIAEMQKKKISPARVRSIIRDKCNIGASKLSKIETCIFKSVVYGADNVPLADLIYSAMCDIDQKVADDVVSRVEVLEAGGDSAPAGDGGNIRQFRKELKIQKELHGAIQFAMDEYEIDTTVVVQKFGGYYLSIRPIPSEVSSVEYVSVGAMRILASTFSTVSVFREFLPEVPLAPQESLGQWIGRCHGNRGFAHEVGGKIFFVGIDNRKNARTVIIEADGSGESTTMIGIASGVTRRGYAVSSPIFYVKILDNNASQEQVAARCFSKMSDRYPVSLLKNDEIFSHIYPQILETICAGKSLWLPR